jgi:branched-chain amino acid transport system ATP-binding protein
MTEALLDVRNLEVSYGDIKVVWDVSLKVEKGSTVALIGSNGAGKTTILRALSGLLSRDGGSIRFCGEAVGDAPPSEYVSRGLVHVPEGRRLFAGLSVYDNLMLGAYHRSDRAQVRADLERVMVLFPRLRERRRQDASTLSGGEQQMCAIGRGLMAAPKLLMIDELSLGLAPRVVEELASALAAVSAEGTSLLVVEQDVATALDLSDRAYIVDQGRTILEGPSSEVLHDPAIRSAYIGI